MPRRHNGPSCKAPHPRQRQGHLRGLKASLPSPSAGKQATATTPRGPLGTASCLLQPWAHTQGTAETPQQNSDETPGQG